MGRFDQPGQEASPLMQRVLLSLITIIQNVDWEGNEVQPPVAQRQTPPKPEIDEEELKKQKEKKKRQKEKERELKKEKQRKKEKERQKEKEKQKELERKARKKQKEKEKQYVSNIILVQTGGTTQVGRREEG